MAVERVDQLRPGATTEGATTEGATTEGATTAGPTTESATTESATTESAATESAATEGPTTEGPTTEGHTTEGERRQPADRPRFGHVGVHQAGAGAALQAAQLGERFEVGRRPERAYEGYAQHRDVGVGQLALHGRGLPGGDERGPAGAGAFGEEEDLAGGAADVHAGDDDEHVRSGELRLHGRALLVQRYSTAGPRQR
jgi:hypothetical protein